MGIQRLWVRGARLMGCYMLNVAQHAQSPEILARNEPCPVAIWVGHHPAIEMERSLLPRKSLGRAGGALGEALRLVPSVTHGDKIMVPADAEIVIEGFLPPNRIEAEGPFAEFSGYQGPQIPIR